MNPRLLKRIMALNQTCPDNVTITVFGKSMKPMLSGGDKINVKVTKQCSLGDVVVFFYNGELLVHRVIKLTDERIWCKGDNSFRTEKITHNDVFGNVVSINGMPIKPFPKYLTSLSYIVSREFYKAGLNKDKIEKTGIYIFYRNALNMSFDDDLLFQRDSALNYDIENNIVAFNDENIIRVEKEPGMIINFLECPKTFREIKEELFLANTDEHLAEHITDLIIKKIVHILTIKQAD